MGKLKLQSVLNTVLVQGAHTRSVIETLNALVEKMLPQDTEVGETAYHHQTRLMLQQEYVGAAEEDFTEGELNMVLKKVKIGKAPGPDLIPPELLKKNGTGVKS